MAGIIREPWEEGDCDCEGRKRIEVPTAEVGLVLDLGVGVGVSGDASSRCRTVVGTRFLSRSYFLLSACHCSTGLSVVGDHHHRIIFENWRT